MTNWPFHRADGIFTLLYSKTECANMSKRETWQRRVTRLHRARGLAAQKFAEYAGYEQSTFSRYISGKRKPDIEDFERWAEALTRLNPSDPVTPAYLLFGDPDPDDFVAMCKRMLHSEDGIAAFLAGISTRTRMFSDLREQQKTQENGRDSATGSDAGRHDDRAGNETGASDSPRGRASADPMPPNAPRPGRIRKTAKG
jgi:transcriptional regulator with XRE-family HTH domain